MRRFTAASCLVAGLLVTGSSSAFAQAPEQETPEQDNATIRLDQETLPNAIDLKGSRPKADPSALPPAATTLPDDVEDLKAPPASRCRIKRNKFGFGNCVPSPWIRRLRLLKSTALRSKRLQAVLIKPNHGSGPQFPPGIQQSVFRPMVFLNISRVTDTAILNSPSAPSLLRQGRLAKSLQSEPSTVKMSSTPASGPSILVLQSIGTSSIRHGFHRLLLLGIPTREHVMRI